MRSYGSYSYPTGHNTGRVEIGSTHATVFESQRATPIVAKILGKTLDENGEVIALVLDRLIGPRYLSQVGPWKVSGVFVTQLTKGE